jgi:hypothetical protein
MNVALIYKQILDDNGMISKIELIEADENEQNAAKFTKLYSLQIPHDIKGRVSYQHLLLRVNQ